MFTSSTIHPPSPETSRRVAANAARMSRIWWALMILVITAGVWAFVVNLRIYKSPDSWLADKTGQPINLPSVLTWGFIAAIVLAVLVARLRGDDLPDAWLISLAIPLAAFALSMAQWQSIASQGSASLSLSITICPPDIADQVTSVDDPLCRPWAALAGDPALLTAPPNHVNSTEWDAPNSGPFRTTWYYLPNVDAAVVAMIPRGDAACDDPLPIIPGRDLPHPAKCIEWNNGPYWMVPVPLSANRAAITLVVFDAAP